MTLFLILLVLVACIVLYVWYGVIVTRRNRVGETLGGIDAQLQQRHDLIPNVLAIARRFLDHEKTLLDEITQLRAQAMPRLGERDFGKIGEKFQTEASLGADINRLFAVAENYPELTSSGPMIEAQRAYSEVEANIAAARRFYNSAVGELRNAVEIFPGGLLAGAAGVKTLPPFFEAQEASRAPVNAMDHL
ncbi:MAG: LemA family protein [Hyphomicrobiales bacterium]|nr:MAG: LemA family protein [Hyphomicrobiales bacterium]